MDVISNVFDAISQGEAVKANGPIEHWLTTLATGFWGFDDSKEDMWAKVKKGDVMVFQAGPPNGEFVEKYRPKSNVSGFIGVGIVDRTSKKEEPRWLSEVIESRVHKNQTPKLWQNLVHFSHVFWFGAVDDIPALAVQNLIEGCTTSTLDLGLHIERLAQNKLSFGAMSSAGFTCAPMGTGGRLIKNSDVLARLFQSQANAATCREYTAGIVTSPSPLRMQEISDISHFKCLGSVPPTKRPVRPSTKASSRKVGVRNKDYLQEAADNQRLGFLGECLVLAREQQRVLIELGESYASKVTHVSLLEGDGAGYDIRTFRQGDAGVIEQYLEVKTTSGDVNTAFFISENEVNFAAVHMDRFEIVRVHSLDLARCEYFEYRLTAHELLGTHMTPVSYRVHVGVDAGLGLERSVT